MPSETEVVGWNLFGVPMPEITRRIGKALRRKGFSVEIDLCWERKENNAYAGPGTVDGTVDWLIAEFGLVLGDKQYPGFVNLMHDGQLIQVVQYNTTKYNGKVIVVLPHSQTEALK